MPAVSPTVGCIEVGASEVEVVATRVAGIDAKVPEAIAPVQWTIEIGSCHEGIPLPAKQDIAEIQVTTLQIDTIHVVVGAYSHQVVEVDLVGSLILFVVEVQLIRHLVGEEEGLITCLLVGHRIG